MALFSIFRTKSKAPPKPPPKGQGSKKPAGKTAAASTAAPGSHKKPAPGRASTAGPGSHKGPAALGSHKTTASASNKTPAARTTPTGAPGTLNGASAASYPSLIGDYAASSESSQSEPKKFVVTVKEASPRLGPPATTPPSLELPKFESAKSSPKHSPKFESPKHSPKFELPRIDPARLNADSRLSDSRPASPRLNINPPRLNTDFSALSPGPASPLSPNLASSPSRVPGSFVRHSRVLSASSTIAGGLNQMFSPSQSLHIRQRAIITDLPSALSPVVNLANAQRLRSYTSGRVSILAADNATWHTADASLTGTELSIWVDGATKARYVNVQDCTIVPSETPVPGAGSENEIVILQDFDAHHATLRFSDRDDMLMWLAALHLCKFEQNALNEAFTAVILSLRGPELSDIYTLLAHRKRFPRFEWCNVRLPQISNKWVKVFMAIIPGESKKIGRVEMYTSEKLTKKSLILYVNAADSVCNVYPEDHNMVDFNSIMKIEGEVFVNKHFESMFSHDASLFSGIESPSGRKSMSRPSSVTSLSSLNPPGPAAQTHSRSRSTSVNSTSSFFVNALSPDPESTHSTPGSPRKSTHFFKKQTISNFVTTNYLYVMPEAHPGVSALEIMLRNFVHIIDAFKLYGRPESLDSDKKSPKSMLFGLPALPHYGYLDVDDAYEVVATNFDTAQRESWGEREWKNSYKAYLSYKQKAGEFRGVGNIYELFSSFENDASSEVFSEVISPGGSLSRVQSPTLPVGQSKLRKPLDLEDATESTYNADQDTLGRPFEVRRESLRRGERSASGLHPIADMPTPIDDMPFYFSKEGTVPVRM